MYSHDHILESIGVGRFQYLTLCATGLTWSGDAMEMSVLAFVLPKLKAEVEGWNPRVDPVPIHAWMHPWLPLAANELEELYPVIRYGLGFRV